MKIVLWTLLLILGGGLFGIGLDHKQIKPKTVIGVFQCQKLLGLAVVTSDGEVHPAPSVSDPADIDKILKLVPEDHQMAINTPCGGSST